MPAGVFVDESLGRGLMWLVNNPDTQTMPWELLLFVNDYTPDESTDLGDLVEPSWGGYARFPLDPSEWTEPWLEDHIASTDWGTEPVAFPNAGGPTQTPYGCAIYDPLLAKLVYAERCDSGDIVAVADGESKYILPRITRRSGGS